MVRGRVVEVDGALHQAESGESLVKIQVLLRVGYRKLTTTLVAERAGVSVGTLYQYFPNRQALILCVIDAMAPEMLERAVAAGTAPVL